MTGLPCLGSPQHKGVTASVAAVTTACDRSAAAEVLPFRSKPYRYHSSVDSLSSKGPSELGPV